MIQKTEAIVLHYMAYTETSIIAQLYTQEHGRVSVLVPGVRQAKARNRMALFMPLNRISIELDFRPKRELQRLREVGLVAVYHSLHTTVSRNAIGLFIAELLYKSLQHEQQNMQLYDFLKTAIEYLDSCEQGLANFHLYFSMQLTRFLGFYPLANADSHNCYFHLKQGNFTSWPSKETLSEQDSAQLATLLSCSFSSLHSLSFNGNTRSACLQNLMKYYAAHIPNFKSVNAISIFKEIF